MVSSSEIQKATKSQIEILWHSEFRAHVCLDSGRSPCSFLQTQTTKLAAEAAARQDQFQKNMEDAERQSRKMADERTVLARMAQYADEQGLERTDAKAQAVKRKVTVSTLP